MPARELPWPDVATRRMDLFGGLIFKKPARSSNVAIEHAWSAPGDLPGINPEVS